VVENLGKASPNFYTILPYQKELAATRTRKPLSIGCSSLCAGQAERIRAQIGALRQIKSPGEIAFLKQRLTCPSIPTSKR